MDNNALIITATTVIFFVLMLLNARCNGFARRLETLETDRVARMRERR
jgi:hypothetical protein